MRLVAFHQSALEDYSDWARTDKKLFDCKNLTAMTTITILLEKADSYRAFAGDKESTGRTAGEALDALTVQLADDESGTLVIVRKRKADQLFNHTKNHKREYVDPIFP